MKIKKVKRVSKVESEFATKFDDNGRRLMVCMNSSKESKYYQDRDCFRYTPVGEEIAAVLSSTSSQQQQQQQNTKKSSELLLNKIELDN